MSVTTTTTTIDYAGDGVTDEFTIPFPVLEDSHVVAEIIDDGGLLSSTLVLNDTGASGFSISPAAPFGASEATVRVNTAPALTYSLRIRRLLPLTQPTDLRNQGTFNAATHENQYDRLLMQIQQVNAGALVAETIATGASVGSTTPVATDAGAAAVGAAATAARSDHKHSATVGTPVAVVGNAAASDGVATSLARSDHQHGMALYASTPAAIGTAAVGASLLPSPGNHVHAHGDQLGGTLHADVTTSTDGFMVAADKLRLDTLRNPLFEFFDDFIGGSPIVDATHDVWKVTRVGTGTITPNTTEEFGCVNIVTTAGATDSILMNTNIIATPTSVVKFACRIKVPTLGNVTVNVGLATTTGIAVYNRFGVTSASTSWYFETKDGTATSTVAAGPVTADGWHVLEIIQSGSTATYFYIDGTLVGTYSGAFKPGTSLPLLAYVYVLNQTGAPQTAVLDYVRVRWAGTTRDGITTVT